MGKLFPIFNVQYLFFHSWNVHRSFGSFFFFKRAKTIVVATKGTIIVLHINIQHEESRREKNVYTAYIYKNRFDIKQCIYRLQFTTVKICAPITPTLLLHCKNVCLNFIAALHF